MGFGLLFMIFAPWLAAKVREYNFFVNPVAIGNGMTIFEDLENKLSLQLVKAKGFDCGVVLHCYEPKQ